MNASAWLASGVSDYFADFTPDQRFTVAILGISCVTGVVITAVIAAVAGWAVARERESRFELTCDLLNQGKSAEEIERIVRPSDGFTRSMQHWFGGRGAKS